ncbi:MAG: hypothetical protein H7Y61_13930, partial [Rhizobiales bacterium]|nr:hypothetical protein [Rhizobacter sp.]
MPARLPTPDTPAASPHPPRRAEPNAPPARDTEGRSTGFGTTLFDALAPVGAALPPGSVFDVCHVGVVLRALLFVHGVLAIGAAFVAASFAGWVTVFAAGSSAALPAVLLWLLVACAGRRPFGALNAAA